MNIIITGALGHIGTFLLSNSHKLKNVTNIYAIDKLEKRMNYFLNLKLKRKVHFINLDLSKKNINLKIKPKIHTLIHLASMTDAASSVKFKKELFKNNINCFNNIFNFCKKNKVNLIHISSTSVYGTQKFEVDENCKDIFPQSPYAEVKVIEEKKLQKSKKKFKYISLRFGTIAGPSSGIRFHTAVNKFCMQAYLKEPLHVWSTALHQYRPYLSLRDAFKTFKFILKKDVYDRSIYNVVSENLTVNQIIKKIDKIVKSKIKLVNVKIMNQLSYKVSNLKIKKLGLKLNAKINNDIINTFTHFKNKKIYEKK